MIGAARGHGVTVRIVLILVALAIVRVGGYTAEASVMDPIDYPIPEITGPIPEGPGNRAFRSAGGDEEALLERYGYHREEYFVEGDTSLGPYRTRILIAMPDDPARFTGVVVTEIFQTSVWLQIRDYMMRTGHGWAMISSRGNRWLTMLKGNRERYSDFILPDDELNPEILYQVVALLRRGDAPNPIAATPAHHVILAGYSGDGAGVRMFIDAHHADARYPGGEWVFDGYYVTATAVGSAPTPIPDIELPVIELMNENEMIRSFERGSLSLAYRRPDGDNYRLYEIAGAGHITTRGRSDDDPYFEACNERPLSQFPMNHLYANALHRLVLWITEGAEPPHAARILYRSDGRTVDRDYHGNAMGGVRSTYLDVPVARYNVVSTRNPEIRAQTRCEMVAHAPPLAPEMLERLYGSKEGYVERVEARLAQLIERGWYLAEDADEIRAEAQAFEWPGQIPDPQPLGIEHRRPVFGGACKSCPWGAVGEIVKKAMAPYGYDVQICYNCARADAPRIVAGAKMPPRWSDKGIPGLIPADQIPPPPRGPVDFGATSVKNLLWAYEGSHGYSGEGARDNLRLIGTIQQPGYLLVAVRAETGVEDLGELREKAWPPRILARPDDEMLTMVLAHYDLTVEKIAEAGGSIDRGTGAGPEAEFDLVIQDGSLGNAPEFNLWYNLSQHFNLRFLQLPEELLKKLAASEVVYQRVEAPVWLLRGMDQPVATVARSGHAVYGRDDMPEEFAYVVAKAMDEQQALWQWGHINFSYNVHTVWQAYGVPLHPGAERYYRERGYMSR